MTLGKPVPAKINLFLKQFQPGFDTPPVLELFIAKNIPKISLPKCLFKIHKTAIILIQIKNDPTPSTPPHPLRLSDTSHFLVPPPSEFSWKFIHFGRHGFPGGRFLIIFFDLNYSF